MSGRSRRVVTHDSSHKTGFTVTQFSKVLVLENTFRPNWPQASMSNTGSNSIKLLYRWDPGYKIGFIFDEINYVYEIRIMVAYVSGINISILTNPSLQFHLICFDNLWHVYQY